MTKNLWINRIYAIDSSIQKYSEVTEYTYDAWGNTLTSTDSMANINPLRYRGYYYDSKGGNLVSYDEYENSTYKETYPLG